MRTLLTLLLALAAAAPALAQEPIRVGLLTIRSGAVASCGRQMEEGFQVFVKERNGMVAGRKLEVFVGDSAGQPAQTRTKAQEHVERNKVHVIVGPIAAFEAIAISDYIRQVEMPTIISPASADDITQRKANLWFVRASMSASQPTHPLGEYAAKKLGYKRVATISDDFAYGHEHTAGFQRTFEENGGKIVQKLWPPLNVADYGSYITQLKTNVDAIYAGFGPQNGLRFIKQFREYGLKTPILGTVTTIDEGHMKSMTDEFLGVITAGSYSSVLDNPLNRKFVAAMQSEFKDEPGFCAISGYMGGVFLEAGVKAVNGKIEDKAAFMKALHALSLPDSPVGPVKLDAYGNPITNIYIRRVERRDGRLVNAIIETYPDVSQFWKYDPKWFLGAPVYSRDYPPAKNLE
jgi:branched-chain amino acid transport system substrate-binding protein